MNRHVSLYILSGSFLALSLVGCECTSEVAAPPVAQREGPYGSCRLNLTLPDSALPPPWAPDQLSKLTIDGKDFSLPRGPKRSLKVDRPAGAKTPVTISFSFWPNIYTNIIRTKKVTLPADRAFAVDLTARQGDDQIIPIYFPTPDEVVEAMCRMAKIGKTDVVYDIGCGDGRLVITAVKKFGAMKGVGIDIREDRIAICKKNAKKAGVTDRVDFKKGDALKIKDWSEASVVLLYLGDDLNMAIRPALQKTLKPGARIVSHRFKMGDWQPDESKTITAKNNYDDPEEYHLHLWTIKKR